MQAFSDINKKGFSLIECMVSLVILCIIVTGSFYSYGIVQLQIKKQAGKRTDIAKVQGLMETAMSYIINTIKTERPRTIDELKSVENKILAKYYAHILGQYSITQNDAKLDLNLTFQPEIVDENLIPSNVYANIWLRMDKGMSLYTEQYVKY